MRLARALLLSGAFEKAGLGCEVMVRLASIGFCCGELAEVQAKMFKMVQP